MNDDERQKLEDIHAEIRETRTQVEVVDDRTQYMSDRMDDLGRNIGQNATDIDDLRERTKRNTTILNGLAVGFGGAMTWVVDKFGKIV